MKLPRRNFLHLAAGAAALPAVSRIAKAQAYPMRPVRLIVGWPPGGPVDLFARLIGQPLSERLGQPIIIENRPGAASNMATEAVVRAPPDSYTLLMISSVNAYNATLYDKLNFDFVRDIAPVASIYRGPGVLVVHPSFPAKSVPELIAYAKSSPGKINMASAGVGSTQHVYGELFKMMTGVDMLHVLSGRRAGDDRLACRASASHVRHAGYLNRTHQVGQTARAGGDLGNTLGCVARHPDRGRLRVRLRGNRLAGGRRTQEHPGRGHRKAQP